MSPSPHTPRRLPRSTYIPPPPRARASERAEDFGHEPRNRSDKTGGRQARIITSAVHCAHGSGPLGRCTLTRDLRPWFPVKLLCAPAPHSVVRFQVQPFLFLFSLNLAAIFGGKRAPVANRPSPFPSALIKRGDSWHPLPRVELMTLFSCGAEIQWKTIVFPRICTRK